MGGGAHREEEERAGELGALLRGQFIRATGPQPDRRLCYLSPHGAHIREWGPIFSAYREGGSVHARPARVGGEGRETDSSPGSRGPDLSSRRRKFATLMNIYRAKSFVFFFSSSVRLLFPPLPSAVPLTPSPGHPRARHVCTSQGGRGAEGDSRGNRLHVLKLGRALF